MADVPGARSASPLPFPALPRPLLVRPTGAWLKRDLPPRPRIPAASSTSALERLSGELEAGLGLPVKVSGSLRRGRVTISFGSKEELQRVYGKLTS